MPPIQPDREVQEPPFCLQIELTEGCNLRCGFCGINGIRGKENDFRFMSFETALTVTNQIVEARWNPRIEFAMHGEPSLNPEATGIVKLFRNTLGPSVNLMMTSNGAGFLKSPTETIDQILKDLNVLALDWYENVHIVPKILERYKGRHTPIYYPADPSGNPHHRRKASDRQLVIIQDIASATKGTHATLNNHAGCGAPLNDSAVGKRCAKPFRELSVRYDGNVAVCCNDWRGIYRCGSVHDISLIDIWNGDAMRAARRKLYHGLRDFGPCQGCDAISYRPGLLPDHKGKETVPLPTTYDERVIQQSIKEGPYTLPVLRPWEIVELSGLSR